MAVVLVDLFAHLGLMLGSLVGVFIGSYLGAIWLCLAARFLQMSRIAYRPAFLVTLITNFTIYGVCYSVGLSVEWLSRIQQMKETPRQIASSLRPLFHLMNPLFILYIIVLGLILSALLYQRFLRTEKTAIDDVSDTDRLTFGNAFLLASVAQAIGAVAAGFIGAFLSILISAYWGDFWV